MVVEPQFQLANDFSEGLAAVAGDWYQQMITIEGLISLDDGKALVGERWGFIDRSGAWVIPPQFGEVRFFKEGLAATRIDDQWGFVNPQGAWAIAPQFDYPLVGNIDFDHGFATVRKGDQTWLINQAGAAVLTDFAGIAAFKEGRARFQRHGKCGFLDEQGKVIAAAQFHTRTQDFKNGLARVYTDEETFGYMNAHGVFVWAPQR